MHYCYILFSEKLNRFYTGATQDSLEGRIEKHNNQTYGGHHFTAKADDWKLYLSIACESFSQARKIELHIKRMKSSTYIKNLLKHPEIIDRLKATYRGST